MYIDELEILIGDIEFDDMYNKYQKENRKLKRVKNKLRKKFIKRMIFSLSFYVMALNILFKMKYPSYDNYYSEKKLVATKEDIKEGIKVINEKLNVNLDFEDADKYLILKSIIDNQNLSESEKEVAYELFPILEDNDYYNKEFTYHSLETVDVDWSKSTDASCLGLYKRYFNIFNGYEGIIEDFLSQENDKKLNYPVLRHELIHALFSVNNITLPNSFEEGMTELLTNEYYDDNPYIEIESYPFEILYVKMLCEIVGEDNVLKAYTTGDMSILYNELKNIKKTSKDACELLNKADDFLKSQYDKNFKCDYEKYDEIFTEFDSYMQMTNKNQENYLYYRYLMDSLKSIDPYSDYLNRIKISDGLFLGEKLYFANEDKRNKQLVKNKF